MALKTIGFEGHSITMVASKISEFLQGIDEKNFVDLKLVSQKRENVTPSEYYAAIVIYRV